MTATNSQTPSLHELSTDAHLDAILRCWTREQRIHIGTDGLRVTIPGTEQILTAKCTHLSRTGLHSFEAVELIDVNGGTRSLSPEDLLDLVTEGSDENERRQLRLRTRESVENVARFAAENRMTTPDQPLFLAGERSLLLGHLMHPAPKSRDQLASDELEAYSPELTGRFCLHWFEAHRSVVTHDNARTSAALDGMDTPGLLEQIAGATAAAGHVLIPAHPWQARDLTRRPAVRRLVDAGLLRPLGPLGDEWHATSSLRTVFHPHFPVMLKLSLGLRLTNSVRESTATELRRGVEVHHLVDSGYLGSPNPDFTIVKDPAWMAVTDSEDPTGGTLTGLDVAVREVPQGIDRYICLAGLIAASRPAEGHRWGPSHLSRWVQDPTSWLASYVDNVLVPMVHLYSSTGVGLEGHQQNTLVRLDDEGRVTGGGYRDNQGYYLATSHLPDVLEQTGRSHSTLAVVDDRTVDDRLTYYLLHNQALSLVGAMAAQSMADEGVLLGMLRDRLVAALPLLTEAGPDGDRLVRRWLEAETLPCKANLATRLHGIDEVVAPLDAQSIYIDVPNPLAVVR